MNILPKLALTLVALASGAAGAATVYSSQADQERRDRNREEALAAYHASPGSMDERTTDSDHRTLREKTHHAAQETRAKTHKTAQTVRGFTHRQAEKVRDFTDRENAKYGASEKNTAGENAKN